MDLFNEQSQKRTMWLAQYNNKLFLKTNKEFETIQFSVQTDASL